MPTPDNISSAFDLLLEELRQESARIAQEYAPSLQSRSLERVREVHAQVEALLKLEDGVRSLRSEWEAANGHRTPPPSAAEAAKPLATASPVAIEDSPDASTPTIRLDEIVSEKVGATSIKGTRPVAVIFPDGGEVEVHHWNQVAVEVVNWLDRQKAVPLPFAGRSRSRRWFLNSVPEHSDGKSFDVGATRRAGTPRRPICVDTMRSAGDLAHCLSRLAEACGVPARTITFRYRPGDTHT
jgi:hypothetical protein